MFQITNGDCVEVLKGFADNSIDAVATDSPYGLGEPPPILDVLHAWLAGQQYHAKGGGFMGRAWDAFIPSPEVWRQCLRVLKPGGHLVSFFGPRTYDVGTMAIRIAGFEIRDQLAWLYGSGMPHGLDISKALDAAAGAEREVVGKYAPPNGSDWNLSKDKSTPGDGGTMGKFNKRSESMDITAPATPEAVQWSGWNTQLKPAQEPIVLARKPIGKGLNIAQNVLKWGTGAINVDATRVAHGDDVDMSATQNCRTKQSGNTLTMNVPGFSTAMYKPGGRWPANLAHDGSPGVSEVLGEADKFFYCAKPSPSERNLGLGEAGNTHCTVKPVALMRWLVRMITPPGGTVLDPFMGSGTTGVAATFEEFEFEGIDSDQAYCEMARIRNEAALREHVGPFMYQKLRTRPLRARRTKG